MAKMESKMTFFVKNCQNENVLHITKKNATGQNVFRKIKMLPKDQ